MNSTNQIPLKVYVDHFNCFQKTKERYIFSASLGLWVAPIISALTFYLLHHGVIPNHIGITGRALIASYVGAQLSTLIIIGFIIRYTSKCLENYSKSSVEKLLDALEETQQNDLQTSKNKRAPTLEVTKLGFEFSKIMTEQNWIALLKCIDLRYFNQSQYSERHITQKLNTLFSLYFIEIDSHLQKIEKAMNPTCREFLQKTIHNKYEDQETFYLNALDVQIAKLETELSKTNDEAIIKKCRSNLIDIYTNQTEIIKKNINRLQKLAERQQKNACSKEWKDTVQTNINTKLAKKNKILNKTGKL